MNDSKRRKVVYEFHSENGLEESHKPGRVQEKAPAESRKSDRIQEKQRAERPETGISDRQIHSLEAELKRTGVGMEAVKGRYGFDKPQDMSGEMYSRVMRALAKTKSAEHVA